MKDKKLLFDRKSHVLYSKPCKKEILAKIAQSVHKRKAQFYPIFIIGCYINGTLLYFPDNMFHIFLHLII